MTKEHDWQLTVKGTRFADLDQLRLDCLLVLSLARNIERGRRKIRASEAAK